MQSKFSTNGSVKERLEFGPIKNFAKLRFHSSNRDLADRHVARLREGMVCDLHDLYPGVVSQDDYILDGQHRFRARRELGLPVYMLRSDMSVADVAFCNDATRAYTLRELFRCFAALGVASYMAVDELAKECANLPFQCVVNAGTSHGMKYGSQGLRNGFYRLDRANFVRLLSIRCAELVERWPHLDFPKFYICMSYLLDNDAFDFSRFRSRLAVAGDIIVRSQDVKRTMEMLEQVYNYNMQSGFSFDLVHLANARTGALSEDPVGGLNEAPRRTIAPDRVVTELVLSSESDLVPHPATRAVNETRLRQLTDAMANDNRLREYPIIIDKMGQVMDGNHRLAAARELGLDIYVVEASDASMVMLACAACLQRNWYLKDYVKHYAEEGREDYETLRRLKKENKQIGERLIASALAGEYLMGGRSRDLQNGEWSIATWDVWKKFRSCLRGINDRTLVKGAMFRRAVLKEMLNDAEFPGDQLVEKINRYGATIMGRTANVKEMRDGIYRAINYRQVTRLYRRK